MDVVLQGAAIPSIQQQQQGQAAAAVISTLRVAVDKRSTGGFTPQVEEGGPVPLPVDAEGDRSTPSGWLLPDKQVVLDVFVDHSLIEVYAMDGLARVTSRIYPADETVSWGLAAYGSAMPRAGVRLAAADIWSMDNAWTGQPPLC